MKIITLGYISKINCRKNQDKVIQIILKLLYKNSQKLIDINMQSQLPHIW